jgi:hypothetical protein
MIFQGSLWSWDPSGCSDHHHHLWYSHPTLSTLAVMFVFGLPLSIPITSKCLPQSYQQFIFIDPLRHWKIFWSHSVQKYFLVLCTDI